MNALGISSDIEIIVFPREAKKFDDDFFQNGDVVTVIGAVSKDGDEENAVTKVLLNSCEKLDLSNFAGGTPIYLNIDKNLDAAVVDKLYDIINANDGGSFVFLTYKENSKKITFKFKKKTSVTVKEQLENIVYGDKK